MIVHPHPDLVNAYDPQYGIARLSDRREQITTVAIRLWNADHDYLQGVNRKLWDMNMDEGGIPADVTGASGKGIESRLASERTTCRAGEERILRHHPRQRQRSAPGGAARGGRPEGAGGSIVGEMIGIPRC